MINNMSERKKLYRQGKSDREIADELGMKRDTITCWRWRHNLPFHEGPRKWCTVGFDVTTRPEHERALVRQFVSTLIRLTDRAGQNPDNIGVGKFMNIWRENANH